VTRGCGGMSRRLILEPQSIPSAAGTNALIFPTSQQLMVITDSPSLERNTAFEFEEFLPPDTVSLLEVSQLMQAGSIVTTAVPEPAAVEMLAAGLALIGACLEKMHRNKLASRFRKHSLNKRVICVA